MTSATAFLSPTPLFTPRKSLRAVCPTMVTTPETPTATPATSPISAPTSSVFGRIITAMVTPFKRNGAEVDYGVAEQLAAHLVANGSDALVIAGTTGESPTLTWSEQYELFNVVKAAVGGRAKVIAGAGSNSTHEAVEATQRAAKLGLDGTLQVVPYYNKPPQEGLYAHFKEIAMAEPDLPVMLYNIPSRTGINMKPEIICRLARMDNIVAIKQGVGDLDQFVQVRKNTSNDFHIYAADDSMLLPFLSLGGTGIVSVASHFVGRQLQELVSNYVNGDVATATEIHIKYSKLFSQLFCMTNPIPTKTALRLQGWPVGGCRLPLVDATPEVESMLGELLGELGLL